MEKKSWLKKDFSELRKEREKKAKPKRKRSFKVEVKRELPIPKEKPKSKPKKVSYTVKVWAKGDNDPWKFDGLNKEEVGAFVERARGESEGLVRIGHLGLINVKETVMITIDKVKEEKGE